LIETIEFRRAAAKIWSEDERAELISYNAHNPFAGDVIPGVKAARKFRCIACGL
jgi:hypothetical protein